MPPRATSPRPPPRPAAPPPPAAPATGPASRRPLLLVVGLVLAVIAGWWLLDHFSDAARIRRAFKAMARAIAEEKLLALAPHLSRRYSDPYGQSYESLLGMASDVFSTYEDLRFSHTVESASVSGTTASVELRFRLYGSSQGKDGLLLGESATPCRATLLLRNERGRWIVERVESIDIPNAPPPGGEPERK